VRRILAGVLAVTMACAGGPAPGTPARDLDVITAEELTTQTGTARQAIERLRPRFLRVRGPSTIHSPEADRIVVYVDNTRMGGVEVLDQLRSEDITEIRYLGSADATSRYGMGHSAGAIVITRR
jgi:hypothetical protein